MLLILFYLLQCFEVNFYINIFLVAQQRVFRKTERTVKNERTVNYVCTSKQSRHCCVVESGCGCLPGFKIDLIFHLIVIRGCRSQHKGRLWRRPFLWCCSWNDCLRCASGSLSCYCSPVWPSFRLKIFIEIKFFKSRQGFCHVFWEKQLTLL